jgi:hypothetical protein
MTRLIARPIFTFAALTLALMLGVSSACALDDVKVFRGVLVLEGKIEAGDSDKVRSFLGNKANFEKINGGVFVASPGGNLIEAIKIGRLIRALRLSTEAPSGPPTDARRFSQPVIAPNNIANPRTNYQCSSACFFIYVSGVYRNLGSVGRLGIHRPMQLESEAKKLDVDEATNLAWRVRAFVKKYLEDMNIPDKYVDLMYSVPPNEVRWISQSEFDSDIGGFVPDAKRLLSTKCNLQTKDEATEVRKCWMAYKVQLSTDAWNKVFTDNKQGVAKPL